MRQLDAAFELSSRPAIKSAVEPAHSKLFVNRSAGLILIVLGVGVVVVGLLVYAGALSWFGRLPGDIRYESDNVRVYVPIVSLLIASVVLSLLLYLLRRFF